MDWKSLGTNPFASTSGMFGSDNLAGAHPRIVEAVARYNGGFAAAYGEDELTKRIEHRIADLFERECAVFLVGSGTAANALSLSAMCPAYGGIYCHSRAHIMTDESGAPEMFTGGAKLVEVDGPHGKVDAARLDAKIGQSNVHGIHNVKPAVVAVTNQTELGTIYKPAELMALSEVARARGLRLFLDGARFSNAVAGLNFTPAEMTWKVGVDVMSFGATKGGAIAAEAIVFFNPADAAEFGHRRKRGGQLWSKHRFLAAQFEAYLEDDLWLTNARHANGMAARLADGLAALPGVSLSHPAEGNEVFPHMPDHVIAGLQRDGFVFYVWAPGVARLVTSWATPVEEVDALLASARRHANG